MRRIAAPLLIASLFLTSCSSIDEFEATTDDITRIEQSLVRGSEMAWELAQAQSQLTTICMEDLGFSVHHPSLLHGGAMPDRFEGFASPYSRIPTRDQAAKFGFGFWVQNSDSDEARAMLADQDYQVFAADDLGWWDLDEEAAYLEWNSTDKDYQEEWLNAFMGPERLEFMRSLESEEVNNGETVNWPPFSGCEQAVIEIMYGEPIGSSVKIRSFWTNPELQSPLTWISDDELYGSFSARYDDEENDFLSCIEERGYGEWEFDDFGFLATSSYLSQLYQGLAPEGTVTGEISTPKNDNNDETDPEIYEFTMALDFAECAEAAGLREGTEQAWSQFYVEGIMPWEAEIYDWEQGFEIYLSNAQEYING